MDAFMSNLMMLAGQLCKCSGHKDVLMIDLHSLLACNLRIAESTSSLPFQSQQYPADHQLTVTLI